MRPGIGDVALALALRCLGLSLGLIGCLALFPVRVSLGLGCARGPRVESNNISLWRNNQMLGFPLIAGGEFTCDGNENNNRTFRLIAPRCGA